MASHYQGFGGVGASGYGRYGGVVGFKNFSNRKGCLLKKPQSGGALKMSTPPFDEATQGQIRSFAPIMAHKTQCQALKFIFIVFSAIFLIVVGYMSNWSFGLPMVNAVEPVHETLPEGDDGRIYTVHRTTVDVLGGS